MKILDILTTASGNIFHSKLRTFLTVIAIFIGAFTLTLTTGIGAGISQYIDSQVGSIGAKNVLIIQAKQEAGNPLTSDGPQKYDAKKADNQSNYGGGGPAFAVLTTDDITKIKAEPGITDVSPQRSVTPSYIYGENGEKYVLSVSEFVEGTNVAMNVGSTPDNDSSSLQLNLPHDYVSALGFSNYSDAIGKEVTIGISDALGKISEVKVTIVGIPEKSLLNTAGGANVNTALYNKLYDIQSVGLPPTSLGKYPAAVAHFNTSYSDAQITTLKSKLDTDGYKAQTVQDTIGVVKQIINSIVYVFDAFAVIALLAASFGVINTLFMSVQERTKEIGLMKAMGMRRNRIFLLFSTEAVLLGFWGSVLGVLAAIGVGGIINDIATKTFLKDFEGLHLLAFPPLNILYIILGIMVVAFLAGTLPARRASGLDPIDALRYE